jgi:hypothetical protein
MHKPSKSIEEPEPRKARHTGRGPAHRLMLIPAARASAGVRARPRTMPMHPPVRAINPHSNTREGRNKNPGQCRAGYADPYCAPNLRQRS